MTSWAWMDRKCSVCGKNSRQAILGSTISLGCTDLDTRPSELERSTMDMWVLECPHCGYVTGRLEDDLKIDSDYLNSQQNRTCDGIDFKSKLSERFYKKYRIESNKSNEKKAYYAVLH